MKSTKKKQRTSFIHNKQKFILGETVYFGVNDEETEKFYITGSGKIDLIDNTNRVKVDRVWMHRNCILKYPLKVGDIIEALPITNDIYGYTTHNNKWSGTVSEINRNGTFDAIGNGLNKKVPPIQFTGLNPDHFKKTGNAEIVTFQINERYTANIFKSSKTVTVGCQTVTFEKIKELAKMLK